MTMNDKVHKKDSKKKKKDKKKSKNKKKDPLLTEPSLGSLQDVFQEESHVAKNGGIAPTRKRNIATLQQQQQEANSGEAENDVGSGDNKNQGRQKKRKKHKKRRLAETVTTSRQPQPEMNDDGMVTTATESKTPELVIHDVSSSASTKAVSLSVSVETIIEDRKQSKKKKKKRNKKQTKKDSQAAISTISNPPTFATNDNDQDKDSSTTDTATPTLEGTMVGEEMVLINRENSEVYSALQRLDDGSLQQVGTLDDNGQVVLWQSTKSHDNQGIETDNKSSKSQKHQDISTLVQSKMNDVVSFPFATDPDDHCESPLEAYRDIVPLLQQLDSAGGGGGHTTKGLSSLRIYDPYFCNGAVVKNLETLGFPNVYNRKEDCYQVWGEGNVSAYPNFDILVTNPPYSEDHMEKLIEHITTSTKFGQRPWCLLLPQFVHKKDYFENHTRKANIRPFFLVPRKRYVYLPPPSFRASKKSDVHKKSSPFISMWYIWGGTPATTERLFAVARSTISNCDVARSKSSLRDLRRKSKK